MEKIKILVDSGSDISKEYCEKYNIDVVPLTVIYKGQTHKDFYELNSVEFCEYLRTCVDIPSTSQPSPMEFVEIFNKYKDEYDHIICFTMAPAGSGTYNSALLAKEMFDEEKSNCQIHVIDSKSCSLNETLEAKTASEMATAGCDIFQILARIEEIRFNIAAYYLIDNIQFLIKGGRVSTLKGTIALKLMLKPIVSIRLGAGSNLCNAVGYNNGIEKLANYFITEAKENTTLYISHADCADKAMKLVQRLLKTMPNLKYEIFQTNCVMTTQSGPDSIGIFFEKSK
ncbi:MAG: DegV family protein [Oscillospiraceae bacterium]